MSPNPNLERKVIFFETDKIYTLRRHSWIPNLRAGRSLNKITNISKRISASEQCWHRWGRVGKVKKKKKKKCPLTTWLVWRVLYIWVYGPFSSSIPSLGSVNKINFVFLSLPVPPFVAAPDSSLYKRTQKTIPLTPSSLRNLLIRIRLSVWICP